MATELSPDRGPANRQWGATRSRFVDQSGMPLRELWFRFALILPSSAAQRSRHHTGVAAMFGWVVTFLIVALIAGVLGFGGIAGASIEIAKAIFFIAIILFLISAVVGLVRGRSRA
jgi:uncharacterized membrane protein YtjA (UPF0391 family)